MTEPKPLDLATLRRQQDCLHTVTRFIKGLGDATGRCPHCGDSRDDWQGQKQAGMNPLCAAMLREQLGPA